MTGLKHAPIQNYLIYPRGKQSNQTWEEAFPDSSQHGMGEKRIHSPPPTYYLCYLHRLTYIH